MSVSKEKILSALREADRQGNVEDANRLAQLYNTTNNFISIEKEASDFDKFFYGLKKSKNIVENTGDYLESIMPLGRFGTEGYISADEYYGEGYMQSTPEERREMIKDKRQAELAEVFPEVQRDRDRGEKSPVTGFGEFTGLLLDPTIFIGSGVNSVRGLAGVGLGFGAAASSAEGLAEEGKIDPLQTSISGALGAAGGAGLGKIGQILNKRRTQKIEANELEVSNAIIEDINIRVAEKMSKGMPQGVAKNEVLDDIGSTAEEVLEVATKSDVKLISPRNAEEAATELKIIQNLAKQNAKDQSKIGKGFADFVTPILSRIEEKAPVLAFNLNKLEFNRHGALYKAFSSSKDRAILNKDGVKDYVGVGDFLKVAAKIKGKDADDMTKLFDAGDIKGVKRIYSKYSKNVSDVDDVYKVISNIRNGLSNAGFSFARSQTYFPRQVKDSTGLVNHLNTKYDNVVERTKVAAQKELEAERVGLETRLKKTEEFTDDEVLTIMEDVTKADKASDAIGKTASSLLKRTVPSITDDLLPYYGRFDESLKNFITRSTDLIELSKFIGKENVKYTNRSKKVIDLSKSISNLVAKEDLSTQVSDDLKGMLMARFDQGTQAPSKAVRFFRDIGYGMTLANPLSALIQLGDIGVAAWINGLLPTAKALAKRDFDMKDFGLDNYVSAMASNPKDLSTQLNKIFNLSGFSAVDRFGKNVYMQSTFNRLLKQSKTKAGKAKISKKYKKVFGDEYDSFLKELQAGNTMDENVRMMIFSELSEVQPISLSKMPKVALENPNGRVFYMLKHYALNQLDRAYRRTGKLIASGDPKQVAEGARNLATGLIILPLMGANIDEVRRWIKSGGQEFNFDNYPERAGEYLLRMVGMSTYSLDRLSKRADVSGFAVDLLAPPISVYEDLIFGSLDLTQEGINLDNRLVEELPVVGDLIQILTGRAERDWYIKKQKEATKVPLFIGTPD